MSFSTYKVNTFINELFAGNPACVTPLDKWLSDEKLLKIAQFNGVPETAFFINNKDSIDLRWFTPDLEMDLCGHATLATAHVLKSILNYLPDIIKFNTCSGQLIVTYENNFYYLDLPSRRALPSSLPDIIRSALNIQPNEVLKSRDYMLIYENQKQIEELKIDRVIFDQINLGCGGLIVTAQGNVTDFVSRFFTPQATILEDPVTGSAHCSLTPYWSSVLNKKDLEAFQLSDRGGYLKCKDMSDRVIIAGKAESVL